MPTAEKHRAVISKDALQGYLDKGYVKVDDVRYAELSKGMPRDIREQLAAMVTVEIDADKHEAMNRAPVKYVVRSASDFYVTDPSVQPVNVKLVEVNDEQFAMVSFADSDSIPIEVESNIIFETEFGAAADSASYLRGQIALHRAAIANIERFLNKYELG